MPKISLLANTATEVYTSRSGNFGAQTRLVARVDPDAAGTVRVHWGRSSSVTIASADTAGVPTVAGESFNDNMNVGDSWFVISNENVDLYYEVAGAK